MNGSIRFLILVVLLFSEDFVLAVKGDDAVRPFPRVQGDSASEDFTVRVDGVAVDSTHLELNVAYAHFAFRHNVRVEIIAKEPIREYDLSPHRAAIAAKVDGNTLSFELSQPRKLHLKVNELPRFFLFAEALSEPPKLDSPDVINLRKLGVRSDADRVQTIKLQQAIDTVAAQGKMLYVPSGIYRCGQLKLKSNLTLYLAPGAIIKGTGRIEDYPLGPFGTQQIDLTNCRNVRVFGPGVIDGQGRVLRLSTKNSSAGRMKLIRSHRAEHCSFADVVLRDSGTWGVHLIESSDLTFTNFKLISNTIRDDRSFPWEPNTDGFDPDNSSRVVIENGFVSCNDDAIALKLRYGTKRDVSDVAFRDNVVWTVKSALKIGSETAERRMSEVAFERNDVVHADRGIVVYNYFGGTIEKCRWVDNHFEFIGGDLKRMHVEIKIQDEEGRGHIADLVIKNNAFENEAEKRSRIQGLDAEHRVDGIRFERFVVAGKRRANADDARVEISKYATATFE